MPEIVISEFMAEEAVRELDEHFDVLYDTSLPDRTERLMDALSESKALVVRNRTRVSQQILDAAPDLRIVARLGVGLDNIDVTACEQRGVKVAPAPGANAAAVAEYVLGAMLHLFRGVFNVTGEVISGSWPRTTSVGRELKDRRLGLVGYGRIAREVGQRARDMGMLIGAHDPYLEDEDDWEGAEKMSLSDVVSSSDALSLHVPLTETTRNLIDHESIASMKPGAVLINTSRGGIVDEAALVEALNGGRLSGAALDVFDSEPVTAQSGRLFSGVPNLILTPHVAGITEESERAIGEMTVASIRNALEGPK